MGPLAGIKIIELAGIGPAPMAAMMLGDMGAEIVRVDRIKPSAPGSQAGDKYAVHGRNRRSLALDLQKPGAAAILLRLVETADGLMEPFRPGVAERLGVGPEACLARNPKLVYGRMTGWGQEGPLAKTAGHDINYIALSGILHAIGRNGEKPVPPLNLVGDFGGGGMLLAFGMLCGILSASKSGLGQVVDAAMVDGSALLFGAIFGMHSGGVWQDERGTNLLDTAAPFYDVYETKDGKYVSIGSIEPQFYALLLQKLGLDATALPGQMERGKWPGMKQKFEAVFKTKTRDEWSRLLEGTDACFAPVLSIAEVAHHTHAQARDAFIEVDGALQPAPAPRFSRTKPEAPEVAPAPGAHTDALLAEAGFRSDEIVQLKSSGLIA